MPDTDIKMYAGLVKKMQDAQAEYFKHRHGYLLREAKSLERQVRKMTQRILRDEPNDLQGELFG